MVGTYLGILGVSGLLLGLLAFGVVRVDTARREITGSKSLLLATGVAISSFAGFLVPHAYTEKLAYVYFYFIKPEPITVSPYEWLAVSLAIGLLISVTVTGLYTLGARYAGFQANSDTA